jgi:hypothetical protein
VSTRVGISREIQRLSYQPPNKPRFLNRGFKRSEYLIVILVSESLFFRGGMNRGAAGGFSYMKSTNPLKLGKPACWDTPAPQKNTIRPSSTACTISTGMSGPFLTHRIVQVLS